MYYAENINAGANTVTVTFNGATPFPDVSVLEYQGIATSGALDTFTSANAPSGMPDSGSLTTSFANELVIAADGVAGVTKTSGPGFNLRVLTAPNGNMVEDRLVAAPSSLDATAVLLTGGAWGMIAAAFRGP
jgi:hypothetical protein